MGSCSNKTPELTLAQCTGLITKSPYMSLLKSDLSGKEEVYIFDGYGSAFGLVHGIDDETGEVDYTALKDIDAIKKLNAELKNKYHD